jgi:hypothetical protein
MAKGESRWNPKDRKVVTNEFRTAPTNDYILKSKKNFSVRCKEEQGAIPYVWGTMEILGTAEQEGGKNISMLQPFYLTLTPRKEDGKPAVDLAGGLTELCQLLNVDVPDEVADSVKTFPASEDSGRGETEALNAAKVKEFLNNLGEFTIKAHVKRKPAKDGWPAKNEVAHFIADEANAVG